MPAEVDDKAPDFSLPSQDRETISLSQYQGKQIVVLGWYALAFTGG